MSTTSPTKEAETSSPTKVAKTGTKRARSPEPKAGVAYGTPKTERKPKLSFTLNTPLTKEQKKELRKELKNVIKAFLWNTTYKHTEDSDMKESTEKKEKKTASPKPLKPMASLLDDSGDE